MAVGALTEPLLPRGRDDRSTSTAPAVASLGLRAAATSTTPPARSINLAAAAAVKDARTTGSSPPASSSPRGRAYHPPSDGSTFLTTGTAGSAAMSPTSTLASPRSDVVPSVDASHASHGCVDRQRSPPPSGASIFRYTSLVDALVCPPASPVSCASEVSAPGSPASVDSSSLRRGRSSPRTISSAQDVGGDVGRNRRSRLGIHLSRGGRRTTRCRAGPRRRLAPQQQDIWSRESFLYMCMLMIFARLVAYLGTMVGGFISYLRFIFIMVFGVAAGLACIGAMALISDTPDHSLRHFAPIVSRLTFLVGSLAFEGAVFYLLGEAGFILWLVVAACTIFGMMYFWRVGHPDSLSTLIEGLRSLHTLPRSLFDCMLRRS